MATPAPSASVPLENRIEAWRAYVRRHREIHEVDVEELEGHLRDQIEALVDGGLEADEAFLIAVRRMGALDDLSREFAREHSERLWKQLVLGSEDGGELTSKRRTELTVAILLAVLAGAAVKLPELFGIGLQERPRFHARNVSVFVLPLVTAFFAWKRMLPGRAAAWLGGGFVGAAVFANLYPFAATGYTEILTAIHLPIALWLLVGVAYAGGRWRSHGRRMDFVRFSGELFVYYVLIALGGGVLTAFTVGIFSAIEVDVEWLAQGWIVPCGAAGAVVVGSWLVEAKQSVIENMAPVLTRLFTPLFALMFVAFLATMAWTGRGIAIEREVLIAFDLLLVVVLGLLLYSISARDRTAEPGIFDVAQVVLVVAALVADLVALAAIGARISDFGFSPNRVAALGENLILLVNLGWSAVLYVRFLRGSAPFSALERWQTRYVPVYSAWAAIVVILFPPLFGYI